MKIEVHHYHHYPELQNMIAELEALRAEVAENTAVDQSAIALIEGLVAKVDLLVQNSTDLQELKDGLTALTSDISNSTDGLAAAVAENTTDSGDAGGQEEEQTP